MAQNDKNTASGSEKKLEQQAAPVEECQQAETPGEETTEKKAEVEEAPPDN